MPNDQDTEKEPIEIDKYEKENISKESIKQRAFIYHDLSALKIYTLVVLFLSSLNLLFSVLFMQAYKLQNITSIYFPVSMFVLLLVSIFGNISIIRVEQKLEKYKFSLLSGTFGFEALMVYFRMTMIAIPFIIYLGTQLVFHVHLYSS